MSHQPASTKTYANHQVRNLTTVWLLAMIAVAVACLANVASAQNAPAAQQVPKVAPAAAQPAPAKKPAAKPGQYLTNKYAANWFNDKKMVSDIAKVKRQILADPNELATKGQFFVRVYNNVFDAMTNPAEFAEIQNRTAAFFKDMDTASSKKNTRVFAGLTTLASNKCLEIAKGNYHPVARMNAVLILGRLDDRGLNRLQRQMPVAKRALLPELMSFVSDKQYSDGIRVAALHGIQRHAILNSESYWQPKDSDAVADLLISLVEEPVPADREPEAHGWIQGMALESLLSIAKLSQPKSDKLAELVLGIPTKENTSEQVLVRAAKITDQVKVPASFKPETEAVIKRWATYISDQVNAQAKKLEDIEKPRPTAGASSFGGGEMGMMGMEAMMEEMDSGGEEESDYGGMMGMGMMMQSPTGSTAAKQTHEVELARRVLNSTLESFHKALTGTPAAVPEGQKAAKGLIVVAADASKQRVSELVGIVDRLLDGVNDDTLGENKEYAEKLRELAHEIEGFIDPTKKPAAPKKKRFFDENPALTPTLTGFGPN